jgi:hypothetical protein
MYQRFMGGMGCFIVAWDCAEKALSVQQQSLMPPDYLWTWWIVALAWSISAWKIAIAGYRVTR